MGLLQKILECLIKGTLLITQENMLMNCQLPKVRQVLEYDLKHLENKRSIYDIFTKKFIPSMTCLIQWREKLNHATRLLKNNFYVQCDIGTFDLKTVQNGVRLLEAKDVKAAVSQELDWFSIGKITPRSVKSMPSTILSTILNHCCGITLIQKNYRDMQ